MIFVLAVLVFLLTLISISTVGGIVNCIVSKVYKDFSLHMYGISLLVTLIVVVSHYT